MQSLNLNGMTVSLQEHNRLASSVSGPEISGRPVHRVQEEPRHVGTPMLGNTWLSSRVETSTSAMTRLIGGSCPPSKRLAGTLVPAAYAGWSLWLVGMGFAFDLGAGGLCRRNRPKLF
jgi:hypothetical protein